MSIHFVYMWFDKTRKMFYVGQHSGNFDDSYISSSRWLTGEVLYRPKDFKRRIIKIFETKNEAQKYEGYLISLIKDDEFGKKYYNKKQGKPKGTKSWNSGKKGLFSKETIKKISDARKGKPTTKGRPNPLAASNGRKGASKMSKIATGRKKKILSNGTWTWEYPNKAS